MVRVVGVVMVVRVVRVVGVNRVVRVVSVVSQGGQSGWSEWTLALALYLALPCKILRLPCPTPHEKYMGYSSRQTYRLRQTVRHMRQKFLIWTTASESFISPKRNIQIKIIV